jgi:hypothetical protein
MDFSWSSPLGLGAFFAGLGLWLMGLGFWLWGLTHWTRRHSRPTP